MAWTVPRTWIPEDVLTAPILNQQIRDNLLETEVAKATSAGRLLTTNGQNAVSMIAPAEVTSATAVTTTSTTPVSLAGGPSTTMTHNGAVLILFGARMRITAGTGTDTTYVTCGPDISGTNTVPALVSASVRVAATDSAMNRLCGHVIHYGSPGTDTIELKYWVSGGGITGEFANRQLLVWPL
jgi:hypothetical protein